ncbi:MAG: prepilin-type N-terminal cleavage/methylation domain-containing protein [Bacillota bacterium]|nr:prepilin-type N-terminal cleavage/methylation domain-containing protein [Bacillota bacterium]
MQKLMRAIHKDENGFTLVELMVVVVIIGILVAIAIPIYNSVTERAEQSAVEANLRTIDGAIMQWSTMTGNSGTPDLTDDLVGSFIDEIEPAANETYSVIDGTPPKAVVSGDAGGETDMTNVTLANLPWRGSGS